MIGATRRRPSAPAADPPELLVTAAPHVKPLDSTPRIMWEVVVALTPVVVAGVWFFGPGAAVLLAASVLGAVAAERLFGGPGTLHDGSAVITGLLLGLTLPPGLPAWMAAVGGMFGIAVGKMVFGGLGQNVFNPALLGRAFLQAAFPTAMTTWPGSAGNWWALRGDTFALPFMSPRTPDIVTSATPLGLMKFDARPTGLTDLMIGSTGGSVGETAGLVILACGAWMAWRGIVNWRIPVAIIAVVFVFSAILHLTDAVRYPPPLNDVFSGGLLLGAVFMATDPVTAPVTNGGRWLFGAGIGLLVVVIRRWGGLPEGVMYSILIFNALVPFINQMTQPRVFGTTRAKARART